ncbi:MAG: Na+/H+ antiporter NhaA, partial [Bryobacteraceae bacterium]
MKPILEIPPEPEIKLLRPFLAFAANKTSGGILLLACTVVALVWANSPWAATYSQLWHTNLTLSLAGRGLSHDLHFWVNDLLMAVFFFVVGLEIKREIQVGELASVRQATLPILAALGGVAVPALIYFSLNYAGPGAAGWGIPMATDIAFALGVMAMLGDRVPLGLKVFLTALAIVDDIAAVVVIAVFYTSEIDWMSVGLAGVVIGVLFAANRLGVRHPLPYALLGAVLWFAVLQSGIHATIAGVALAFTIPARSTLEPADFLRRCRAILNYFERAAQSEKSIMNDVEQHSSIEALETACERVHSPLHRMEHALHSWVTFLIMPVFALANAGVVLGGNFAESFSRPVTFGVFLGLLIGKPIGIMLASWLAVRSGVASLPAGVNWNHVHGAGWLGGIGFTMSLFIAGLAFPQEDLADMAKLGILIASVCAGLIGSALLI